MSDLHDSPTAAFDDDRLLDYALGLEDDPELAAALSRSARLRERLADMKADLAAIETELRRAIPELDDSYADPGAARWSRLRPSFGSSAPAATGRRSLRPRRLATVLLAAALALALVIGIVANLPHGGSSSGSSNSADSIRSTHAGSESAQAPTSGAPSGQSQIPANTKAPFAASGAVVPSGSGNVASVSAHQAADFRDVAVVRAGTVIGADQSFTVVRVLKGKPPASFSLTLYSTTGAPTAGTLAIAYLRPLSTPSSSTPPTYSYQGQRALLTPLPAGVAATAVRLPK
jgi:hypothetical protein